MKGSQIQHNRFSTLLLTAAALVCATMVVAPPSSLVAPAAAQSSADIEKAKEQFRSGKEAYDNERFEEAAGAFHKAYDLSGRSELLYNVARAYWKAEKLKKAEKFFQQYLNELPDAANADEVVESIIQIQEEMAAQMSSVEVNASRAGIDIFVDQESEPRCKTPCSISLLPGEHTVSARPEGMEAVSRTIEVEAEQSSSVRLELPGRLEVKTDQRSATVRIADQGSFRLPMSEPIVLKEGTHNVSIVSDDARWSGEIDVVGGELTSILVPLGAAGASAGPSTLRTVSYGLAGVSAGLLVGGIVMGMQASDTHQALESQQTSQGSVNAQMVEQGQNEQFGANLMYTLSAVSLASGAGLFAWDFYGGETSAEEKIPASKESADSEEQQEGDDLLDLDKGSRADKKDTEDTEDAEDTEDDFDLF
jgi:hypothetical protein